MGEQPGGRRLYRPRCPQGRFGGPAVGGGGLLAVAGSCRGAAGLVAVAGPVAGTGVGAGGGVAAARGHGCTATRELTPWANRSWSGTVLMPGGGVRSTQ